MPAPFPGRGVAVVQHGVAPPVGALMVRVPARGRSWPSTLPPIPGGRTLTVTLGHADLATVPVDDLVASGYRIVGIAADHRPLGQVVDVLVPAELRTDQPAWWAEMFERADRVFDLAFGPVAQVLAAELELHLRAVDLR